MVFRSISVGLLGALLYLVATLPRGAPRHHGHRDAARSAAHTYRIGCRARGECVRPLGLERLRRPALRSALRPALRPAFRPPPRRARRIAPRVVRARPPVAAPVRVPDVTVIDVARGLDGVAVASLVALRPGERIATVDDRPVASDAAAGAAIAARVASASTEAHGYIDLGVRGAAGGRRVLVMLH